MSFKPVSLLDVRTRIAAGALTAQQAVAEARARIEAGDGAVGAFARLADPAAQIIGEGPLAGIAIGIKDIFDTYDMATECGSPILAGWRPRADAAIVAMLRAKGATIIGKTVTTEFAFLNPAGTRNPHNLAHTPGGSSSGSAAAVAAGMVPAAIGTQTGGSIVRPAAYCGVAGYKPSFRLVPATGVKAFSWSLDTVGFFAASIADVAALAALATGRDLASGAPASRLRVGLYRHPALGDADAAMTDALVEAAARLENAGHKLIAVEAPPEFAAADAAHRIIQNFEAAHALMHEHRHHRDQLSPILLEALDFGAAVTPEEFDEARRAARRGRRHAHDIFGQVDVLLLPSAQGAAPASHASTGSPIFNRLWTLLGLPAVNVPGLRDEAGMPLGMQIIGPFGRDRDTLSAALALENLL
jgi:Asp-tRNA(Asn)/Glu-tRNA(Gln) amidotransferase A subunit family amidase